MTFLDDISHPDTMRVAIDLVIFNIINNELCVLVVKRAENPYKGSRCLPGGFVKNNETVEQTADRVLYKETHIVCTHIKHLGVFSDPQRDPRWRTIGVGFYTVIYESSLVPAPGINQQDALFIPIIQIPKLAFDHDIIQKHAYTKLQHDIETTDFVKHFLPKYFTLNQLKTYCEILMSRTFEKRNFMKYVHQRFQIKRTSRKEQYVKHRPAYLYKFVV